MSRSQKSLSWHESAIPSLPGLAEQLFDLQESALLITEASRFVTRSTRAHKEKREALQEALRRWTAVMFWRARVSLAAALLRRKQQQLALSQWQWRARKSDASRRAGWALHRWRLAAALQELRACTEARRSWALHCDLMQVELALRQKAHAAIALEVSPMGARRLLEAVKGWAEVAVRLARRPWQSAVGTLHIGKLRRRRALLKWRVLAAARSRVLRLRLGLEQDRWRGHAARALEALDAAAAERRAKRAALERAVAASRARPVGIAFTKWYVRMAMVSSLDVVASSARRASFLGPLRSVRLPEAWAVWAAQGRVARGNRDYAVVLRGLADGPMAGWLRERRRRVAMRRWGARVAAKAAVRTRHLALAATRRSWLLTAAVAVWVWHARRRRAAAAGWRRSASSALGRWADAAEMVRAVTCLSTAGLEHRHRAEAAIAVAATRQWHARVMAVQLRRVLAEVAATTRRRNAAAKLLAALRSRRRRGRVAVAAHRYCHLYERRSCLRRWLTAAALRAAVTTTAVAALHRRRRAVRAVALTVWAASAAERGRRRGEARWRRMRGAHQQGRRAQLRGLAALVATARAAAAARRRAELGAAVVARRSLRRQLVVMGAVRDAAQRARRLEFGAKKLHAVNARRRALRLWSAAARMGAYQQLARAVSRAGRAAALLRRTIAAWQSAVVAAEAERADAADAHLWRRQQFESLWRWRQDVRIKHALRRRTTAAAASFRTHYLAAAVLAWRRLLVSSGLDRLARALSHRRLDRRLASSLALWHRRADERATRRQRLSRHLDTVWRGRAEVSAFLAWRGGAAATRHETAWRINVARRLLRTSRGLRRWQHGAALVKETFERLRAAAEATPTFAARRLPMCVLRWAVEAVAKRRHGGRALLAKHMVAARREAFGLEVWKRVVANRRIAALASGCSARRLAALATTALTAWAADARAARSRALAFRVLRRQRLAAALARLIGGTNDRRRHEGIARVTRLHARAAALAAALWAWAVARRADRARTLAQAVVAGRLHATGLAAGWAALKWQLRLVAVDGLMAKVAARLRRDAMDEDGAWRARTMAANRARLGMALADRRRRLGALDVWRGRWRQDVATTTALTQAAAHCAAATLAGGWRDWRGWRTARMDDRARREVSVATSLERHRARWLGLAIGTWSGRARRITARATAVEASLVRRARRAALAAIEVWRGRVQRAVTMDAAVEAALDRRWRLTARFTFQRFAKVAAALFKLAIAAAHWRRRAPRPALRQLGAAAAARRSLLDVDATPLLRRRYVRPGFARWVDRWHGAVAEATGEGHANGKRLERGLWNLCVEHAWGKAEVLRGEGAEVHATERALTIALSRWQRYRGAAAAEHALLGESAATRLATLRRARAWVRWAARRVERAQRELQLAVPTREWRARCGRRAVGKWRRAVGAARADAALEAAVVSAGERAMLVEGMRRCAQWLAAIAARRAALQRAQRRACASRLRQLQQRIGRLQAAPLLSDGQGGGDDDAGAASLLPLYAAWMKRLQVAGGADSTAERDDAFAALDAYATLERLKLNALLGAARLRLRLRAGFRRWRAAWRLREWRMAFIAEAAATVPVPQATMTPATRQAATPMNGHGTTLHGTTLLVSPPAAWYRPMPTPQLPLMPPKPQPPPAPPPAPRQEVDLSGARTVAALMRDVLEFKV